MIATHRLTDSESERPVDPSRGTAGVVLASEEDLERNAVVYEDGVADGKTARVARRGRLWSEPISEGGA